jgi:hypothetical protein
MSRSYGSAIFLLSAVSTLVLSAQGQLNCTIPAPPLSVHRANFFTPEQEQWIGQAQAERIEPDYILLPTSRSAYLDTLGARILAQLPPTPLNYTFHVFESGGVSSFSLAGGQIYVSRKLILDAKSEDELAGALAHEIASVYTGHEASMFTREMEKLMDVHSLGDRASVVDTYQRFLNIPKWFLDYKWNSRLSVADQQDDELLSDRVGFYAYTRAGFAPDSYSAILNRTVVEAYPVEGFRGNFVTDALNLTSIASMRSRLADRLVKSLPADCHSVATQSPQAFRDFQVAMNRAIVNEFVSATPGLKALALDPPMSQALENVRISPDAHYVLAQDAWKVHVFSRAPLHHLFSIDAQGAQMADFTPDSREVVFGYPGLRYEDWDVAGRKPEGVLEYADYNGCPQSAFSPDGHTVACFSRNFDFGWLRIADLQKSKIVFEDSKFFRRAPGQATGVIERTAIEPRQGSMIWSQDGRFFVGASGTHAEAVDTDGDKLVNLGYDLGKAYQSRMAFVGSDKLLFECDWGHKEGGPLDTFKMCYSNFPSGTPLGGFMIGRQWLSQVTGGGFVLTGPKNDAAAALVDPASGSTREIFDEESVDVARGVVARELKSGGIETGPLGGAMEAIQVPITPLTSLETAFFSRDGKFLAVSTRARGAVWEVATGKQVQLTGPFRNASFDPDDKLEARIETHELKPASDIRIDRLTHKVAATLEVAAQPVQYGTVVIQFKPWLPNARVDRDVTVNAADAKTGAPLWSRHFKWTAPEILPTEDDRYLLLVADRRAATGADEADHNRAIMVRTSDQIRQLVEEGLTVEIVDARTGAPVRVIAAPELEARQNEIRSAGLYGDLVAIRGGNNNTVVYRTGNGQRLFAFFGTALAGDSTMGLIAATNRPQEITVYEVPGGKIVLRVDLDHYPLAARFLPSTRELLVLTASQYVYRLQIPAPPSPPVEQATR